MGQRGLSCQAAILSLQGIQALTTIKAERCYYEGDFLIACNSKLLS